MGPLLDGKMALVTGAGNGIGRATARLFASEGAAVGVADIQADAAEAVSAEILAAGGRAIAIRADVSKQTEAEAAVEALTRAFGGLNVLVNNAGMPPGPRGRTDELTVERWDEMLNVNFRSQLLMCRVAFPWLAREGGAVVCNASSAAITGAPWLSHYGVAKTAVAMLARNLSAEWGPHGIRVNAISPGVIDTGFGRRVGAVTAPPNADLQTRQRAHIPLGRLGDAEDVAKVILFLASDLAGYVSGENILIDGGLFQMLYPAVNGWVMP